MQRLVQVLRPEWTIGQHGRADERLSQPVGKRDLAMAWGRSAGPDETGHSPNMISKAGHSAGALSTDLDTGWEVICTGLKPKNSMIKTALEIRSFALSAT
jgi:hypothetical protein